MEQQAIDSANAKFWDELCGTGFAKHLGITDRSLASLRKFDQAYLDLYPYLLRHVPVDTMRGKAVLEIGLGFGTLGQKIAESGALYTGLDIAQGPVDMMNHRLRMQGLPGQAIQGSMLECPLPDASMDCVVSIGCFHHTGSVARCIEETRRVLKPGGEAYLMVYNAFSYRQWLKWPLRTLRASLGGGDDAEASEAQRKAYDASSSGAAAPETVFAQLRRMMREFRELEAVLENSDHLTLRGRTLVPRRLLLSTIGRVAGLDIYVRAVK